jgi:hypothetical protein
MLVAVMFGLYCGPSPSGAADWIVSKSYYTHDPQTAERVNQYSPIGPFYIFPREDFQESGYHHYQSSIRVSGSQDNYHIVREYGRPVRPYGEWQHPYRPYSVPYSQWGPPFGGLGGVRGPGGIGGGVGGFPPQQGGVHLFFNAPGSAPMPMPMPMPMPAPHVAPREY